MEKQKMYLDIETTLGHPHRDGLLVAGFAVDSGPVTTLDWFDLSAIESRFHVGPLMEFLSLLADPEVVKVEHTKYDARYLLLAGYEVNGPVYDTAVAAHLLNENTPLDLDWLAWKYAGLDMDKRLKRSGGRVFFTADDGTMHDLNEWIEWCGNGEGEVWLQFLKYNGRDIDGLRKLYLALEQRMDESDWLPEYVNERVPYTSVLLKMELSRSIVIFQSQSSS